MVYQDPRTGETLGGALRQWRELSGMTLGEVSRITDRPITHLLGIEADKVGPDADLLRKLASLYSDDCLTQVPEAGWNVVLSWLNCFEGLESRSNREMLCVVATSIRRMRKLPDTGLVFMRDQEADILFPMLDSDDENLPADVADIFGLDLSKAVEFVQRAHSRRERRTSSRQPIIGRIGISSGGDIGQSAA